MDRFSDEINTRTTYNARQLARFPASHHGSPLTYFPQRHVINLLTGNSTVPATPLLRAFRDAVVTLNQRLGGGFSATDDPTLVYSHFFSRSRVNGTDSGESEEYSQKVRDCLRVSISELRKDILSLSRVHPAIEALVDIHLPTQQEISEISASVSTAMRTRLFLEKMRNTAQLNHIDRNESMTLVGDDGSLTVYAVREMYLCVSRFPIRQIILLNYDQVLMLFDTVSCRLMTRIATLISERMRSDNLPPWQIIERIYRWGDELILASGMDAYAVIGEFESIVTGVFVTFQDTDVLDLGIGFIDAISTTAQEIEEEYGIDRQSVQNLISILREIISLNWLSEIFGLRKHWGNPMVDAAESGRAVQEKIAEELPVSGTALIRLLASFNRMVVIEFIDQHGRWPEGYFVEAGIDTPIGVAHASSVTRIPETDVEHRHEHWALFKFLPNCVVDSYQNDLSLISDKSVSVYKSHLDTVYVRNLCRVTLPATVEEDRRLILEYLRTNHLSILDIFRVIMCDAIPDEWLANNSSMKGTEMKHKKARIFAVLTYEIRQYFAATEDLIKNHLFRYNPHQTMTMGEAELLAKLRNITRQLDPSAETRHLSVMHIVDFSKWNLRMRYGNTCLIFKAIDDFLGTPGLIEQTHNIFSNMTNIVQDSFNPPPDGVLNTESDTVWRFHNCGWEGQRQKGWTILTSALLSDLARVTGVRSTICGQGDNQTLLAQFPVPDIYRNPHEWIQHDPDGVRDALNKYYKQLEDECTAVGLKIKTAETCRSLLFFNYGKRLYVNGGELSMTLKRISKNITEPNESYPTSESLLKTLEGSAFAAGLYCHPSLLPYIISRFSVALQLDACFTRNQLLGDVRSALLEQRGIRDFTGFLSILMKIPASLGGPPQLGLPAYLYRGHPDPLCTDMVMVVLRARSGCTRSQSMLTVLASGRWFNRAATSRSSLIAAPYSLNLDIPLSCRIPIEREIKPALREKCRNQLVRGMFDADMDAIESEIVDCLSQIEPFHPLIANDIFSRTLPGRRQSFLSGLANTTSLGRLILDNHEDPMINRICDLEGFQLESWVQRVMDIVGSSQVGWVDQPHHVLADRLRTRSWGIELVGVTVPHPLEQFSIVSADHDVCGEQCDQYLEEHLVLARHSERLITLPGSDALHIASVRSRLGSPYLGSTITEGIIQKQIQCINPDETWRDVVRLNTLRRWIAREGSRLDDMLIRIISSRTDVSLEIINQATGIPSRLSYNHRASLTAVIATCGVSTTTNMHTRLYLSSNRMGQYSHGECNYHMPFGPTFLCFQELVCILGVYSPRSWTLSPRSVYHIHVRCDDVPIVFDGSLEISRTLRPNVGFGNTPAIMFARSDNLEFQIPSGVAPNLIWNAVDQANATEIRIGYSYQLIADNFVKETVVRESVTQDRISGFEPRMIPVTIGDISLVGAKCLIKALAWNFLLLSPMSVWMNRSEQGFKVRAHGFISVFSSRFWETFTVPFSAERNRQQLLRHYGGCPDVFMTRVTSGLRPILMEGVVSEMWIIFDRLKELLHIAGSTAPISLYAPSLPSLKLLLSKYHELVMFIAIAHNGGRELDAFNYSRDIATNALSGDSSDLLSCLIMLRADFSQVLEHLGLETLHLPYVKLYPMQYPWIDKLHTISRPVELRLIDGELDMPAFYPELARCAHIVVPENPVMAVLRVCSCPILERQSKLHTECYFSISGKISKSHLKFMDIVLSLNLDIAGVLCLGTSTGSEAAAFCRFSQCNYVYVNCLHPLSEFSPHIAGSYVPAAFATGAYSRKLVRPSSAVIASSDLLASDTVDAIRIHTSQHTFTGITCDAEFPLVDSDHSYLMLLGNILKLVADKPSIAWVICKVSYKCVHELYKFCSEMSRAFYQVRTVWSQFSRPGILLAYIVGTHRRTSFMPERPADEVPVVILEADSLTTLVEETVRLELCPMFYEYGVTRDQRLFVLHTADDSLYAACQKLIPGWGMNFPISASRELIISSLEDIKLALISQANDLLRISYRTHMGRSQPRNAILQLGQGALNQKLNNVYKLVNRCELLLRLLVDPVLSIRETVRIMRDWVATPHEYPMLSRGFLLDLNATHFTNYVSRYVFEILGHVYKNQFTDVNLFGDQVLFHRLTPTENIRHGGNLFRPLDLSSRRMTVKLSWRWLRRAELLFWMLSMRLSGSPIFVITENPIALDEIHLLGKLGDVELYTDQNEGPIACSAATVDSIISLSSLTDRRIFLWTYCHMCPTIFAYFHVSQMFKCPWTGIIPNTVIVDCSSLNNEIPSSVRYPDFDSLINTAYDGGDMFCECSCWDCVIEGVLCADFGVSHSLLDRLCSMGAIESVRDMQHSM